MFHVQEFKPVNGSPFPAPPTRPTYFFLSEISFVAFCNLAISAAEASTSPRYAFICTPSHRVSQSSSRIGGRRAYESFGITRQFFVPVRGLLAVLAVLLQDALLALLEDLCVDVQIVNPARFLQYGAEKEVQVHTSGSFPWRAEPPVRRRAVVESRRPAGRLARGRRPAIVRREDIVQV